MRRSVSMRLSGPPVYSRRRRPARTAGARAFSRRCPATSAAAPARTSAAKPRSALLRRDRAQAQQQLGGRQRVGRGVVADRALDAERGQRVVEAAGAVARRLRHQRGPAARRDRATAGRRPAIPAPAKALRRTARSNSVWKPTRGASPAQSRNAPSASGAGTPSACAPWPMPWMTMFAASPDAVAPQHDLEAVLRAGCRGRRRRRRRSPAGGRAADRGRRSRCRSTTQRPSGAATSPASGPPPNQRRSVASPKLIPDSRLRAAAGSCAPGAALPSGCGGRGPTARPAAPGSGCRRRRRRLRVAARRCCSRSRSSWMNSKASHEGMRLVRRQPAPWPRPAPAARRCRSR